MFKYFSGEMHDFRLLHSIWLAGGIKFKNYFNRNVITNSYKYNYKSKKHGKNETKTKNLIIFRWKNFCLFIFA